METKIFLVHNGGEYSDYTVLALFTEKELADSYAEVADGTVEEWPANVPPEKWTSWTARLNAEKKNGKWEVKVTSFHGKPGMDPISVSVEIGHYAGWGEKDPITEESEFGAGNSVAQ